MIGSTIGSFVLLGVLSTFLMLGRSGANIVAYSTMDTQTRRALEDFAQDIRMASEITWNNSTSVTITVPGNYTSTSNQVTYAWDSSSRYFYRRPGTPSTSPAQPATNYVANVTSFTFYRYDRLNAAADSDVGTKRIQINMTVTTTNSTVTAATDTTISASFILRNKVSI